MCIVSHFTSLQSASTFIIFFDSHANPKAGIAAVIYLFFFRFQRWQNKGVEVVVGLFAVFHRPLTIWISSSIFTLVFFSESSFLSITPTPTFSPFDIEECSMWHRSSRRSFKQFWSSKSKPQTNKTSEGLEQVQLTGSFSSVLTKVERVCVGRMAWEGSGACGVWRSMLWLDTKGSLLTLQWY